MRRAAALLGCALVAQTFAQSGTYTSELEILRRSAQPAGFERALEPRVFQFPQDQGPHPGFRHEWWYITCNLDAPSSERFGAELTFFRIALQPPTADTLPAGASAWRTSQLYSAHFALTDVSQQRFFFAQKSERAALGLAGASADPWHVWVDDWSLQSADSHSPWRLRADAGDYTLDLQAQPLTPPILNGERGLSRKSGEPGAASYYYSIPRIAVHGRLRRAGQLIEVHGLAWLDREWGSGSLSAVEQGWDWYALQLEDHSTLMFYALRNKDGSWDAHSAGTWVSAQGEIQPITASEMRIDVDAHWVSPRGVKYPARWHMSVAPLGLSFEITPVLADQELGTRPRYWEGAVDVQGLHSGARVAGRGYVELVGYGE